MVEESNSMQNEVMKRIDRNRLIKYTLDLANIDSPTGKEKEVALKYKEILEEVGLRVKMQEVENERYNVIGILEGIEPDGTSLMFNGHMDTSFSINDPWEILSSISPYYRKEPPWAYVKDDVIYGLGVYNMKSALAAYAEVVRAIIDSGIKLRGDIIVAGVVGEIEKTQIDEFQGATYRGYGYGSAYLVQHGIVADYAIIGEPTAMQLVTEHFGSLWVKFTIGAKKLQHSAYSSLEDNVIVKASKFVEILKDFIREYQTKYTYKDVKPPVNVGCIEGGLKWRLSRTPLKTSVYIDFRYPPMTNITDIISYIKSFVKKAENVLGVKIYMETYLTDHWSHIDESEFIVRAIENAYLNVMGKSIMKTIVTWSSDANILNRFGIKTVLFGPAGEPSKEIRGMQRVDTLEKTAKIYALVALDVCNRRKT